MSERVYEDGTPATYEPRTDIISCRMRPEAEILREMIERQPIRRGDVVQVILTKSCRVVVCDAPADGQPGEFRLSNGQLYSPKDVACIGRARYYPDGTTVED